jgi:hypothetical protein
MNGKTSKPRPFSVPQETYKNNYDRIFGKKDTVESKELPTEIQEKLDEITHKIEEYESTISRQTEGNDEVR